MVFGQVGWGSRLTYIVCVHGVWAGWVGIVLTWANGRGFGRESFNMHRVLCSWFVHPTVINNTN